MTGVSPGGDSVPRVTSLWSEGFDDWEEPAAPPAARRRGAAGEPASGRGSGPAGGAPCVDVDDDVVEDPIAGTAAVGPAPATLPVEVIRSAKRTRTAGARIVDGRIVVRVPQRMSQQDVDACVASLVAKLERAHRADAVDLEERARVLARRYDLPEPSSIRWVSNQAHRWGSCSPTSGAVRISDRLAGFPEWVVDAVVVHELAHLRHADHSRAFWALVERYPKTERARGFLMAAELLQRR